MRLAILNYSLKTPQQIVKLLLKILTKVFQKQLQKEKVLLQENLKGAIIQSET